MTRPHLGIVCGMEAEARALGRWRRDPRIAVAVSGGRPERAEAEARRLVAAGARALLSWGIAGGLDPGLRQGTLIAAERVVTPEGPALALATLPRAAPAERQAGADAPSPPPAVLRVTLAGSDTLLLDAAAKAALRARTGAAALDMESHRVAAMAAEAGLPCYALRAVSDTAGRALPRLAATALGEDGRPRIGAVLLGLARRPGDMAPLIRAARDSRAALAALARAADTAIPALLAR